MQCDTIYFYRILFIYLFLDKPSAIENLKVFKKDNCTFFKIPLQSSSQCKHNYNVYTYDTSKTLILEYLNRTENEFEICDTKNANDKIAFVKTESVWLNNTGSLMKNFVAVKLKNISDVEKGIFLVLVSFGTTI